MIATEEKVLKLKVSEALGKDVGRAFARLDPSDIEALGVNIGDIIEVLGKRKTVCKAMPAYKEVRGRSCLQIDGISRDNAGTALDQHVQVRKAEANPASLVVLSPITISPSERDLKYIGGLLDGLPVMVGDRVRVTLFGTRSADFKVVEVGNKCPAVINPTTKLRIGKVGEAETKQTVCYEDIGGLGREILRIREIIELPLCYPRVFERLGIDPPKGVLMIGPPGCGKTLLARAVAHETEATFFSINGPEVIHKFYGESEAHLRSFFKKAAEKAPSIIFIDEIDAIAPHREKVVGDVEKRVVAQLLALMDGLAKRQQVIVIAATNIPNAIDPALRRPGRFDREIVIPIPDRESRKEILVRHTRGMPLDDDVDIERVASITHGFVGADLEALCREAAMICLRHIMTDINFELAEIPYETLSHLRVHMADFVEALREVEPSAIREVFTEVPEVDWTQVGGLSEIKQRLLECVEWPIEFPALFKEAAVTPPKGILLSGPPGCGKTLLAKALAKKTEVNFISVKGPSLLSKYVGESEKAVRDLFRKAKQAAPCIVFFDEIDALVPGRGCGGSDSRVIERVISQFLTELDGIELLEGVFVLGATNRPDLLDTALLRPGRFDMVLEIPLPDIESRRRIFEIWLKPKPICEDVDILSLAESTEGFSGAEIHAVCNESAIDAIRELIVNIKDRGPKRLQIEPRHIERAIKAVGDNKYLQRHDSNT
ncbi:MAG: CDC48 family AAA ATPase [Verrucomicrobia bacterium]|nr:CDC48 family AAA ATPase [Verrucomicrobiota bacterium]MCF7707521.1 CDC48 family AAA ATPase [Verrucomicrobiota bacterium]